MECEGQSVIGNEHFRCSQCMNYEMGYAAFKEWKYTFGYFHTGV